ncbi:MAG: NADP-dependent oxidoreductase, partial [Sphingomonas sp.]|nr:NADP-dependent oxidoreductase [Sphingomonas sp.]
MSRPEALPGSDNFALKDYALPQLGENMVHVRNRWLSVDPYMRGRMNEAKSYIPPFALDAPMEGGALGEVIESSADGFKPGDLVVHMAGWRDEAVLAAKALQKAPQIEGVDPQAFLGILGMPGATAYFGLLDAAEAKEGDRVFVSAAAGAVGSAVVQMAKAKGMTVIGSARGKKKCEFVRSLGADAAIDYTAGPLLKTLREAAPDGIDVYFDNVGGDHLDAAFARARLNARFALCGMIGGYNSREAASFRYMIRIIAMRITVRGFLYGDYVSRLDEFYREVGAWVASGTVKSNETVVDGLDGAPDAFLGLF